MLEIKLIKCCLDKHYHLYTLSMNSTILEKRTVNDVTVILALTKLYDQPFRKTYQEDISRKARRGGVKFGYFIYIFSFTICII